MRARSARSTSVPASGSTGSWIRRGTPFVVYRRDETGTWGSVTIDAGGILTTPLLPGLVLKAESIFAE